MKANGLVIVISSLIVIFGGVLLADLLGVWHTESNKEPMKFTSGAYEGQSNPDDIRGSYTFSDIENAFGVEASLIAEAFGVNTDDPGAIKAKDIEEIYSGLDEELEIGTGSVKRFVAIYTQLPYDGEDLLPLSAVVVLKSEGKWTDEIAGDMDGYILENETIDLDVLDTQLEGQIDEVEHDEEIGIKGKTTVADAISYGISLETIESVLGIEIKNENMLIRDLCDANGLSFGTVKEALSELIE